MKKKSKSSGKSVKSSAYQLPELPARHKKGLADSTLMHMACLVFLVLILYANTLNAPFQWDEGTFITTNPIVKDLHYFARPSEAKGFGLYDSFITRYVGYLTFALNYRIHGFSVTGYHIVNIAIHMANSMLVYFLVLLTLKTPFLAASSLKDHSRSVAFFSAAIFAAHPLQIEAVTYVFQRFASLAAFFYLLSIVAYIKFRLKNGDCGNSIRYALYAITLLSAVLAMKTKENAFTLPMVITLYEFCFFRDTIKKRILHLGPILITLFIIPLTLMSLTGSGGLNPGSYGTNVFPQKDYLLTQFRVIITYLRLLFLPVNQDLDYDYPVFKSFFDPQVALSFAFLSTLAALGIYLVIKSDSKAKSEPLFKVLGFGILWFFITLSVESSIIPLPMLIDEYRVYLPSVGVIMSSVTGAFLLKEKMRTPMSGKIVLTALALTIAGLSAATYLRNDLWTDKVRLWEDVARKSPHKARPHLVLGLIYQDLRIYEKAEKEFLTAIKLKPNYADVHNDLGVLYKTLNMPDKAMEQYQAAVKLQPDNARAHDNIGVLYQFGNMPDQAEAEFLTAIKLKPEDPEFHYNLGVFYKSMNRLDKAMEQYLTAVKLEPDFAGAHSNLGGVYLSLNMLDKAEGEFRTAIRLKPDLAEAHFYLGFAYYKMGQLENAQAELTRGLEIKPDNQQARGLLSTIAHQVSGVKP